VIFLVFDALEMVIAMAVCLRWLLRDK